MREEHLKLSIGSLSPELWHYIWLDLASRQRGRDIRKHLTDLTRQGWLMPPVDKAIKFAALDRARPSTCELYLSC